MIRPPPGQPGQKLREPTKVTPDRQTRNDSVPWTIRRQRVPCFRGQVRRSPGYRSTARSSSTIPKGTAGRLRIACQFASAGRRRRPRGRREARGLRAGSSPPVAAAHLRLGRPRVRIQAPGSPTSSWPRTARGQPKGRGRPRERNVMSILRATTCGFQMSHPTGRSVRVGDHSQATGTDGQRDPERVHPAGRRCQSAGGQPFSPARAGELTPAAVGVEREESPRDFGKDLAARRRVAKSCKSAHRRPPSRRRHGSSNPVSLSPTKTLQMRGSDCSRGNTRLPGNP